MQVARVRTPRLELDQSRKIRACALHREYSQRCEGNGQHASDDHEGQEKAIIDHGLKT